MEVHWQTIGTTQGQHKMKEAILKEYTNQEIDWLSEMIQEKLADMGHENVSTFSFEINVCFTGE